MKMSSILPEYPRTPHLPFNTNVAKDDIVAAEEECQFVNCQLNIEEKVDGASVGMTIHEDHPVIRNRDHILRKGYVKETTAKKQFASIWGWFYKNKPKFEKLTSLGPFSVYGEWMVAAHGIRYTRLPDLFIAYDVYNYEDHFFLPSPDARKLLLDLDFSIPTSLFCGEFSGSWRDFEKYRSFNTPWSDELAEGIYIKVFDDKKIVRRYKMVSPDFQRGKYWDVKKMTRNIVSRSKHNNIDCGNP